MLAATPIAAIDARVLADARHRIESSMGVDAAAEAIAAGARRTIADATEHAITLLRNYEAADIHLKDG